MKTLSLARPQTGAVSLWRDCIAPKEHGSWSLAFEPIVLSLLVAPSVPGSLLAVAFAGGFFARRPLRIAWSDRRADRRNSARSAFFLCVALASLGLAGALGLAGLAWSVWLAPVVLVGALFAYQDTQGAGREEAAEVTGSAAFALAPAAFAILAGWSAASASGLAVLMVGRSVPSVLLVRAFLRAAKTGVRRDVPALVTASIALVGAVFLHRCGIAPAFAVMAMLVLLVRALAVLVLFRPEWRARRIGMIEAVLGGVFVVGFAISWCA